MDNQQLCNLFTNNQIQVLLTGVLGDGCFNRDKRVNHNLYLASSIHKEYMELKKQLLGDLTSQEVRTNINNGYKKGTIYTIRTVTREEFQYIKTAPIATIIQLMDELGLALWVYDDGSLHKNKGYYNIYTCSHDIETHENVFVPFLKDRFGIKASIRTDKKKDGRVFFYLSVGKYDGAHVINAALSKYKVSCFNYKLWSSETNLLWCKLQEKLKSEDANTCISNIQRGKLWEHLKNTLV